MQSSKLYLNYRLFNFALICLVNFNCEGLQLGSNVCYAVFDEAV